MSGWTAPGLVVRPAYLHPVLRGWSRFSPRGQRCQKPGREKKRPRRLVVWTPPDRSEAHDSTLGPQPAGRLRTPGPMGRSCNQSTWKVSRCQGSNLKPPDPKSGALPLSYTTRMPRVVRCTGPTPARAEWVVRWPTGGDRRAAPRHLLHNTLTGTNEPTGPPVPCHASEPTAGSPRCQGMGSGAAEVAQTHDAPW